jgi:aspartate racemase
MKTIGLLGGMSWESTAEYYRLINQVVNQRLGSVHSAKIVMVSVDFAEIEVLQSQGKWAEATQKMIAAARQIEAAGADFLLICTNTMHLMAKEVQAAVKIPLLHIADVTAQAVLARGFSTIGFLATRFTMQGEFYTGRLESKYGLKVILPSLEDQETVHRVIYEELVVGKVLPSSREAYIKIISKMATQGAQGVALACTEIGMLVKEESCSLPLFDTTPIHAFAAVDFALKE